MRRDRARFFRSAMFVVVGLMAMATSAAIAGGADMAAHGKLTKELFDSGVPHSQTAVLSALYGDAQEKIRGILLAPKGMTQASREFRQSRAAEQTQQIRKIIQRLGDPTVRWAGNHIGLAYRQGIQRANLQAAKVRVPGHVIRASFHRVNSGAAEIFARNIVADLNRSMNALAAKSELILKQTAQYGLGEREISALLARGVIEGTPRETTRSLRDELIRVNDGNLVPVRTKSGGVMHFDAAHYSEIVCRTQTRQATVMARHDRLEDLGLDLVVIEGAISNNPCTAFLGTVWSLSGNHPKYPAYDEIPEGGPPFHPLCSKGTAPYVEELASAKEADRAELSEDVRTLTGMKDWKDITRAYKDLQIRQQVEARFKA